MMMQFVHSMCSNSCFGAFAKTGFSHSVLAASGSQDITVKDVFGSIVQSILPTFLNMFTFVLELLASVLMLIVRFAFNLIDFVYVIVQQLAGQNTTSLLNENLFQDDFLIRTLTSAEVLTVFKRMIIFAVVLILVFAIIAVIKTEVEAATNNADNSKKRVLVNAMRSCFFILFVPVIALGGIIASNAVLASISRAIGLNNGISISSQIYVASAVEANQYRMYAMGGKRIPITYDFDWQNDKATALETQTMFNTGNFKTEEEYLQNQTDYFALYDKNLRTIQEEYYVMADLIDFMVTNQQEFYIVNANHADLKTYFEKSDDGKNALFDITYTTMSEPVQYSSVLTATDEKDGAKFIMCTKEQREVVNEFGETVTVSSYVPLTNGSMGFKTSYSQPGEIILARGAFTSEGYPTAIKESGNSIHFYREKFLLPTIFDFLPKISYVPLEGMEEAFDTSWLNVVSQTVLGVDIHQFIPYFYYNFEFSALFSVVEDVVAVVNNSELILTYNWSAGLSSFNFYYNVNFNFLILFFAITLILRTLITMMWGLIGRVFEMMLLMISYPVAAATVTLDGGSRHQNWTKSFVGKLFMCYGIVIMMQLTLVLSKVIFGLEIFTVQDFENSALLTMPLFKGFTPQNATILLNRLTQVLLLLVLFSMMAVNVLGEKDKSTSMVKGGSGVKLINDLINTGENVLDSGLKVQKATSAVVQKSADMVSGRFMIEQSKKAVENVFGKKNKETGQREGGLVEFIPGVALTRTMRDGKDARKKRSKLDHDITELVSAASSGSPDEIEEVLRRMEASPSRPSATEATDTETEERGASAGNGQENGNASNHAQNPNATNEENGDLTGDGASGHAENNTESASAETSSNTAEEPVNREESADINEAVEARNNAVENTARETTSTQPNSEKPSETTHNTTTNSETRETASTTSSDKADDGARATAGKADKKEASIDATNLDFDVAEDAIRSENAKRIREMFGPGKDGVSEEIRKIYAFMEKNKEKLLKEGEFYDVGDDGKVTIYSHKITPELNKRTEQINEIIQQQLIGAGRPSGQAERNKPAKETPEASSAKPDGRHDAGGAIDSSAPKDYYDENGIVDFVALSNYSPEQRKQIVASEMNNLSHCTQQLKQTNDIFGNYSADDFLTALNVNAQKNTPYGATMLKDKKYNLTAIRESMEAVDGVMSKGANASNVISQVHAIQAHEKASVDDKEYQQMNKKFKEQASSFGNRKAMMRLMLDEMISSKAPGYDSKEVQDLYIFLNGGSKK